MKQSRQDILQEIVEQMMVIGRHMWNKHEHKHESISGDFNRQQKALLHMLFHNNCLTMGDIADKLNTTQGAVTQQVEGLITKGLLERKSDPHDRRVVRVTFSEKGSAIFKEMHKYQLQFLENVVFSSLSDQELAQMAKLLAKIGSNLTSI